jgi:hypothetical protein
MILDLPSKSLYVRLAAATVTNSCRVVTSYVDVNAGETLPGNQLTQVAAAAPVEMMGPPATGHQRILQSATVFNKDTTDVIALITLQDGLAHYEICRAALAPNEALQFTSSSGWQRIVSDPAAPAAGFRAHRGGVDQTGLPADTSVKVVMTVEAYDIGSYFELANSRWVPPAGRVVMGGTVFFYASGITLGYGYSAQIRKNGSTVAQSTLVAATTALVQSIVEWPDNANGVDYYEMFAEGGGPGNKTLGGTSHTTYFWGQAIGR